MDDKREVRRNLFKSFSLQLFSALSSRPLTLTSGWGGGLCPSAGRIPLPPEQLGLSSQGGCLQPGCGPYPAITAR